MKRTIAFKALVGSANYNLTTATSDKDYKLFVLPTFHDLYHSKVYTESKVCEIVDEEYHDIRKLVNLLWKSNVNFVEVLFSSDVITHESKWIQNNVTKLMNMKHDLSTMNLPYLYKACKGMYLSKAAYIDKGNVGTRHLVEQFGYDTKSAMHAYRILDFIERFAVNEFTDFLQAIQYDTKERVCFLRIKNGELTKQEFEQLVEKKLVLFKNMERVYMEHSAKEEVRQELENLLYQFVSEAVQRELNNKIVK